MIQPTTQTTLHHREQIDSYWAGFLGCTPSALYNNCDTVTPHDKSLGLFCLETESGRIFSHVPGITITPPAGPLSREWLYTSLIEAGPVEEVYGPGDLLYCTPETFAPIDETACQPLQNADQGVLKQFAQQVQWQSVFQNYRPSWRYAFGIYQDGALVSAAATTIWSNTIAALKVATLPEYQGRGYGHTVTSAVTRAILTETRLIPQYDTAVSNYPSRQIARRLGFQQYGLIYYATLT